MNQAPVRMYTTRFCPYCIAARRLLKHNNVEFNDIAVDSDAQLRQKMQQESGATSVPQIWIGERHIGGCDELYQLEQQGELQALLFPGS